jgi:hypothetical protein
MPEWKSYNENEQATIEVAPYEPDPTLTPGISIELHYGSDGYWAFTSKDENQIVIDEDNGYETPESALRVALRIFQKLTH